MVEMTENCRIRNWAPNEGKLAERGDAFTKRMISRKQLFLFLVLFTMYLFGNVMFHRFGNAEDLHVSTKCSVELTDENFKSVIESKSGCSKLGIHV